MRTIFKFFLLTFLIISCQADDQISQDPEEAVLDEISADEYKEYLLLNMEGEQVLFSSDIKDFKEENLGSKLIEKYTLNGELYYSLELWGVLENASSNQIQRLGASIEYFNGEGVYKTGKDADNNCNYFDAGISWHSHYDTLGEGYLEITSWDKVHVKGNFDFMIYNANDKAQFKNVTGEFDLLFKE